MKVKLNLILTYPYIRTGVICQSRGIFFERKFLIAGATRKELILKPVFATAPPHATGQRGASRPSA
jgi:hypothetical protein